MKLVIVESPSKAKTISKYLGDGFIVRASVGHVRDLPKSSKKAINIEGGFIPHYEIVPKKLHVIDDISTQAVKADEIILATDPDREGEAIAWHIAEVLKERLGNSIKSKFERIAFHEITKEAINEALLHPRKIDEHLREAQEARRVLDRIVGYDLSGLVNILVRDIPDGHAIGHISQCIMVRHHGYSSDHTLLNHIHESLHDKLRADSQHIGNFLIGFLTHWQS